MEHPEEGQSVAEMSPGSPDNYTPKTAFLEFGSTSIKFYLIHLAGDAAGQVEKEVKIPWDLGYDVFEHQRISPGTVSRCLLTLRALQEEYPEVPFGTVTAVGTAALREAQNIEVFRRLLWEEIRVHIRIIEGGIEAFLLETGFRDSVDSYPTALFDLGGGSLELVEYLTPNSTRKTSVPLGAIRLHCQLRHTRDLLEYIDQGRHIAEKVLREQLLEHTRAYTELIGTAGTVRAIVKIAGKDTITWEDVHELIQREIRGPVWHDLPPHRRKLLLPGLLIIESLFSALGIERITHRAASVKSGLLNLARLLPAGESG